MKFLNVRAVIFDHGGVLTRGGEKGTNEKAASAAMGLKHVIHIPDLNEALKRGWITNREYVDEINAQFPNTPRRLTMAVWDDIYSTLAPDVAAYAYAGQLRERGLRVGLLSSVNQEIANRLADDDQYIGFDPLVLSCDVGFAKPDPEIYQLVEQGLGDIHPQQILFLDDQEKCCAGAVARGWNAIRVDSTEQMITETEHLLERGL